MTRFRPQRGDRGASIVEAAFAIPLFFLLLLGLVDFGLTGFEDSQAGNAARDGARVGIIGYTDADVVGSADHQAIVDAIEKNLPGREVGTDTTVTVSCIEPDGTPIALCADARVDIDRLRVQVSWDRDFISPVAQALGFRTATVDGDSTMVIIGAPVAGGGVAPLPCLLSSAVVTPASVEVTPSGQLSQDLSVDVVGTGSCGNLAVNLVQGANSTLLCTGPSCLGVSTYVGTTDSFWVAGAASVVVTGDDSVNGSFTVTPPPATCSVTGVTASPTAVQRYVGGSNAGRLLSNMIFAVAGTGACNNLTLTVTSPGGSSAQVCGPATCVLGNNGYSGAANNFWTAGTATVSVADGLTPVASTTFTVTDAPVCTVSVSVTTSMAPVATAQRKSNGKALLEDLTVVITPGSSCTTLSAVLEGSNGTTQFPICTGTCAVTYTYPNANQSTIVWPVGNGTVRVTGDAIVNQTFQVVD